MAKWDGTFEWNCLEVEEVLTLLVRSGVTLPEGETALGFRGRRISELMDFGERLYNNQGFWDRLPRTLVDNRSPAQVREALRSGLYDVK